MSYGNVSRVGSKVSRSPLINVIILSTHHQELLRQETMAMAVDKVDRVDIIKGDKVDMETKVRTGVAATQAALMHTRLKVWQLSVYDEQIGDVPLSLDSDGAFPGILSRRALVYGKELPLAFIG